MFEWYEVAGILIAFSSLILGKRRYDLMALNQAKEDAKQAIRDKKELENKLNQIELRLHHLDDAETGRVNKMSKLCESQIESNKQAYAMAYAALEASKNAQRDCA